MDRRMFVFDTSYSDFPSLTYVVDLHIFERTQTLRPNLRISIVSLRRGAVLQLPCTLDDLVSDIVRPRHVAQQP